MTAPMTVEFTASGQGTWCIDRIVPVLGEALQPAAFLSIMPAGHPSPGEVAWRLRGTVSNARYSQRSELVELAARQEGLGRPA